MKNQRIVTIKQISNGKIWIATIEFINGKFFHKTYGKTKEKALQGMKDYFSRFLNSESFMVVEI